MNLSENIVRLRDLMKLNEMVALTTDKFIEKAKEVHDNERKSEGLPPYDYSKVEYITNKIPVEIICPIEGHGPFPQHPINHLRGAGCPECGKISKTSKLKKTNDKFIEQSKEIHDKKRKDENLPPYDYSKTDYKSAHEDVEIICPIHGPFPKTPNRHLKGEGCQECSKDILRKRYLKDQDEFINQAKIVHGDIYDYSKTNYQGAKEKVIVTCPKHGDWAVKPNSHLNGTGCPRCQDSVGEKMVKSIFERWGWKIDKEFVRNKTYEDCLGKKKGGRCRNLSYDFYLPSKNTLIEYDGKQHFMPIDMFGGEEGFEVRKKYDQIKNDYAEKKGIKLIRIPYTLNKPEEIEIYMLGDLGLKKDPNPMKESLVILKELVNLLSEKELKERCWKGYTQKGMKTMFGKRYPNCVKKKK